GRKAQGWATRLPAALAVGDLQHQRPRAVVLALRQRDVDRAVGWLQPAAGDQVERPVLRRVVPQVCLDPVVLRHALELAPAGPVEVTAVNGADRFRRVLAVVVPGAGNGPG